MNKPPLRFLSLDVFRGMTVCFMIIVNTPGSGAAPFAPLLHASWHGFTPTDLVFPSFLFAVGNAMSFSMNKCKDISNVAFLIRILKRTVLIFVLGYLMYWFPFFSFDEGHLNITPVSDTRIMGVLQRIALCYFFASLMIRFLSVRTVIALSVLFLIGYWIVLLMFGDPADPFSMQGNAGQYLDKFLFGDSHLYHGEGIAFDPEGLLSTVPAIVNVIIGYFAGKFIQQKARLPFHEDNTRDEAAGQGKNYETISKLLLAGSLLILLALCWNMIFPINKKLWTSSFVLLTTGLDLIIIAALVYIVEVISWNKWNWTKFFTVFGKNPLFIYLLSELLIVAFYRIRITPGQNLHSWINTVFFQVIAPGAIGSLLFAITYMLICWVIGWWLDKRHVYIKV
jgi:predicted acyltransferase